MQSKIEELSNEEFKQMLENMSNDEVDKITASDFFGVLAALEDEEAEEIIELRGKVENGAFVFEEPAPIPVFGNAIKIGNKRIIVTLANPQT
ncbi:MAG: hypothetical protein ACE5PV_25280 [Candidatus Poribacteria bacterium]